MSDVYYKIINERAEASYKGPEITRDNYNFWEDHWIKVAKDTADEFERNGLILTAQFFREEIIKFNEELIVLFREARNDQTV